MVSQRISADFDVDDVLAQLNIDEKVSLLAGRDAWHTVPIRRLGIPSIRVSDGPNGVRGIKFFDSVPAACLPCGTGLAATWDTELIKKGANLQGREAIAKGASVILGPTVNMQRSPLGGRGFESFSEDPVLAGNIAAATVNGIQSTGVAATLKHYVCNDGEHQRALVNAIVSERALREIYLMPFQIAERDAKPVAYMTSYNKVNGLHASESPRLIKNILREEWGFDGLVMSDWFGTYSTAEAINAGLDLEMPGPAKLRGPLVHAALGSGKILPREVDNRAREVLKLIKKSLPLNIPEDAPENTVDSPETAALLRAISANSIVLMKNEQNVLPLKKDKSLAVIGPNAALAAYCGGGSAALNPYYAISPLAGIKNKKPDSKYCLGVSASRSLPLLSHYSKTKDGTPGIHLKFFKDSPLTEGRQMVDEMDSDSSDAFIVDYKHPKIESDLFWVELDAQFSPEETMEYDFGLTCAGTAKLWVDEQLVVDNETKQTPGDSFFGSGTHEERGSIKLEQGKTYNVHVKFATFPTITFRVPGATPMGSGGFRVGCYPKLDKKKAFEAAIALAKEVDQVVICAGLTSEWESEGWDREHMGLPPGSDELIAAVVQANPNTAVVMQSGTPVKMPWLKDVPALMHAWYGGNETGNAIADVLFGDVNPSGKLSLSFPLRNEDNPAFLSYRSEGNRTIYGEDVYIGYRFYERTKRDVAFPFGHGLSYTTFEHSDLSITTSTSIVSTAASAATTVANTIASTITRTSHHHSTTANKNDDEEKITISLQVHNTGSRDGSQVIQVYIAQQSPPSTISRPPKELKGFTKVFVPAGQKASATVELIQKYACSYWDELADAWVMHAGKYTVLVGDSSEDAKLTLKGEFEVKKTMWWRGL